MQNSEIEIGRDYLEADFYRTAFSTKQVFRSDWEDQPSRFTVFSGVERIPLIAEPPPWQISLSDVLTRNTLPLPANRSLTFEKLSWLLQFAAGILNQRLALHWSSSSGDMKYGSAYYGRGTPSGGGCYPTELYLCSGPSSHLLPGLYHYDTAHHALERLYSGNMIRHIHAATFEHPAAMTSDQFLLISLNFWKNAFKYGDFAYHLGTQDVGALLASLRILALALQIDLSFLLWYKDEALNRLLGQETIQESVFALIPLQTASTSSTIACAANKMLYGAPTLVHTEFSTPKSRNRRFQRSKGMLRFPHMETMHQATLIDDEPLPSAQEAGESRCDEGKTTGKRISLPPPLLEQLQADIFALFQKRRSSFGRFTQRQALSQAELATLLSFSSQVCLQVTDSNQSASGFRCTELMVVINNVEGIERGAYSYDARRHCLWTIHTEDLTLFLQHHYKLQNYNLAETGAVITIVGKLGEMLDVYGNRGYRIMNAEAGQIAQTASLVATALSLGCGIVAGFDNTAMDQIVDLQGTDCSSLLFILVGHERPERAELDCRLV